MHIYIYIYTSYIHTSFILEASTSCATAMALLKMPWGELLVYVCYMCIHTYICIYIYIYIYIHTYMHTLHTYYNVYLQIDKYVCIYIYMYMMPWVRDKHL